MSARQRQLLRTGSIEGLGPSCATRIERAPWKIEPAPDAS